MLTTSGDDGHTWSDVKLVIDPDRDGPERAFDPCLWHDPLGRLWLFWAIGGGNRNGVWAMVTENSDAETAAWSAPRWLCEGIMMNKPIVLSTGEWLLPVARWRSEQSAQVVCSADNGQTFHLRGAASIPKKEDRNCDEHMLVERQDGALWMLVRTTYGLGESVSDDRGKTWAHVAPSAIEHATARFLIRRLRSGHLLLVKHGPLQQRTGRSHLTAYLSDDDGKTWRGGLLIDERPGVSYPDAVQSPDGTIYHIYDHDRTGAKHILLATFTEADVRAGQPVSDRARFRVLINQATGKNPG
jgi:predicted neuraminidase